MYAELRAAEHYHLGYGQIEETIFSTLKLFGIHKRILILPPDASRMHSGAGAITASLVRAYGDFVKDIMPALGTHAPMSPREIAAMFPGVSPSLFRVHDWRRDVISLGQIPSDFIREISEGRLDYAWPAQVNRLIAEGGHDLIISIGQVVPHEVAGMANYTKNLFVGAGGKESIDKSHFLGAVYGIERILGVADTPVRKMLNYGYTRFAGRLPIVFIHTVLGRAGRGAPGIAGLFIGTDDECFRKAAALSARENIEYLSAPLRKAVVYLSPHEYKSTWLGNKSIYRTRLAMADAGELIVLAPGVKAFGEDRDVDRLIRTYGYHGTENVLRLTASGGELAANLSAAAHLIHGSTEGRFQVTYCPGGLSREEVEKSGYGYAPIAEMLKRYDPTRLAPGYNTLPDGEEIFYIDNPALGLWRLSKEY